VCDHHLTSSKVNCPVELREIKGDAIETDSKILERMIWCVTESEKIDMFVAVVAVDTKEHKGKWMKFLLRKHLLAEDSMDLYMQLLTCDLRGDSPPPTLLCRMNGS
jgi:hypothetical protein